MSFLGKGAHVCLSSLPAAAGEEPSDGGGEDDPGGAVLQLREQRCCGAHCGGAGLRAADEGRPLSSPPGRQRGPQCALIYNRAVFEKICLEM